MFAVFSCKICPKPQRMILGSSSKLAEIVVFGIISANESVH